MLIVGAALMTAAGLVFGFSTQFWLLLAAGTIGVVSPSGQEVGPFLPMEQAALSQVVTDRARTSSPGIPWLVRSPRRWAPSPPAH
jgi:hypothetical protein